MINEFLWLELEDMEVDDVYLQQLAAEILRFNISRPSPVGLRVR